MEKDDPSLPGKTAPQPMRATRHISAPAYAKHNLPESAGVIPLADYWIWRSLYHGRDEWMDKPLLKTSELMLRDSRTRLGGIDTIAEFFATHFQGTPIELIAGNRNDALLIVAPEAKLQIMQATLAHAKRLADALKH